MVFKLSLKDKVHSFPVEFDKVVGKGFKLRRYHGGILR